MERQKEAKSRTEEAQAICALGNSKRSPKALGLSIAWLTVVGDTERSQRDFRRAGSGTPH